MSEKYLLEIDDMSKSFGKNRVLKNIHLHVRPGTIMGLMGENGAGKSTMMKCLFGIYSRDSGTIKLNGEKIEFHGPKQALENGVAMVHQELNQCLERTVSDNMFLGRYRTRFGIIDEAEMNSRCKKLFARLNMNVDPKTLMRTMSVSQRQMVEIAKAVSYDAKIIILDEPTSSLSEREVKQLFKILKDLIKTGIGIVFISHKMDEIFELCDDITVLRDGEVTLDKAIKDTNLDEVVHAMVGRSLESRFPKMTNVPGDVILSVKGLSTRYAPHLKDVTFDLRKGEILGIYGLVGAGRSELLETLFGARKMSEGEIIYKGSRIRFESTKQAMDYNFAMITEERKLNGMFGKGGEFQPLGVFYDKEVEHIDAKTTGNTNLADSSGKITADFPVFIRSKVLAKNVDDQYLGWTFNSALEGFLMNMKTTTGAYIYREEMNAGKLLGFPYKVSNQIPTDSNGLTELCFGNWADMLVGEQLGLETYTTLDGSWTDDMGIQHNAFEENLAATRALMYADIAARHKESFLHVKNIKVI